MTIFSYPIYKHTEVVVLLLIFVLQVGKDIWLHQDDDVLYDKATFQNETGEKSIGHTSQMTKYKISQHGWKNKTNNQIARRKDDQIND